MDGIVRSLNQIITNEGLLKKFLEYQVNFFVKILGTRDGERVA